MNGMQSSAAAGIPAHPSEVAEWEDVLMRMELMPRALRNLLEEADTHSSEVVAEMQRLCAHEDAALRFLHQLAEENSISRVGRLPLEAPPELPGDVSSLLYRFTRARTRNFAAVQRRGLEVWDWTGEHPDYGHVSAYQLLRILLRRDGQTLSTLRGVLRSGASAC